MPISAACLRRVIVNLDQALSVSDLNRLDWRRQTDVVQQCLIVARLFADLGPRAVLVDGRIERSLIAKANKTTSIKNYFNRRCHEAGLTGRRVIVYDAVSSKRMGENGSGKEKLHFHAILELPLGWDRQRLIASLARVFGHAVRLGKHQFYVSMPDWEQRVTHNERRARGPIGKLLYAIGHAGSTYRCLDLNDGKRSRSSTRSRGSCNRDASGLAKGVPSNFNKQIVFCDTLSKQAGQEAFKAWIDAERGRRRSVNDAEEARNQLLTAESWPEVVRAQSGLRG